MTSFASNSLRLLRRVLGTAAAGSPFPEGDVSIMDGLSAVACTEAAMSSTAALGATYPATVAARAWSGQGAPSVESAGPRGTLAAAVGCSLAGERATAFLSGPDCLASQDLLAQAAGLNVPLVLHLAARAAAGAAPALGSGHDAYHAAGERGLFLLCATNVQEAVDLAVIARLVAERTLVPGLVAMDAEQTALAAQDVRLPTPAMLAVLVGAPADAIDAPTDAQRLLFGPARRRVPRSYDLERPMMLAPLQGPESWGLGPAARRAYFHHALADAFEVATHAFHERTGRDAGPLRRHRLDHAKIVIVAQGSAVETAIAVADHAHRQEKARVGVLGIRRLRPLPGAAIVEAIGHAHTVAILERVDTPLAGDGPLTRDIRAALGRAGENARHADTHPHEASLPAKADPRLVSVPFGLGGLPLHAADLAALLRELAAPPAPPRPIVHLGVDYLRESPAYPKRQALIDGLRRARPDLADAGLRADGEVPDVRPAGALTIAWHRHAGRNGESVAGAAAALLHAAIGGSLRTRPALSWQRFDEACIDHLTIKPGSEALCDPGDDVPVDVAVLTAPPGPSPDPLRRVIAGGAVLLARADASPTCSALPAPTRQRLRNGTLALHAVDGGGPDEARDERFLGGLLALCAKRLGLSMTVEKARGLRDSELSDEPADTREHRLDEFAAGFTSLAPLEPANVATGAPPAAEAPAPRAVRDMRRADGTAGCLASFWDRTAVLYRAGDTDELLADPHAAIAALPPLTAALRGPSAASSALVGFDPASCTGAPRLWTSCPDASVAAVALTSRELIDVGIALAAEHGHPADALSGIAGKLARHVAQTAAAGAGGTAGTLLQLAFDDVAASFSDARRVSLAEALEYVVQAIGPLPLARTPALFDEPERVAAGTGALLALAVNPDTCRSPDLLLEIGAGIGFVRHERTPSADADARALWELCERLPDTSGAVIERARTSPAVGPLGAMMLSRHCRNVMAGGDGAEPASGARLALRNVLGVVEHRAGPRLQQQLEMMTALRERLAEAINTVLTAGLPTQDLGALAEGLDLLGNADVDLGALSSRVDSVVESGRVDGAKLARLVDAARAVADLQWRIAQGPDGLGRARAGLVMTADTDAARAATYPHNPFACPVLVDAGGETGDIARGLLEGHLRQVLAGVRLLREARRELDPPSPASPPSAAPPDLRWSDLTEEERALCPPIVIVGDGRSLGGRGLPLMTWLLSTDLPVKVLVLNGIGGTAGSGPGVDALAPYPDRQPYDIGLLALLGRRAFVAQTSIAHPDHFADGVTRALAFDGPALVHVHAPSPERHGFDPARLFEQATLAVASRAFPLFTFDPDRDGVFGSCLDLSGNPASEAMWVTDEDGTPLTPVKWAATEARFAPHFAQGNDGDEDLTADTAQRGRLWRTLQELAGVVTPFTDVVEESARRSVAEAHRAEIDAVQQACETKLAEARGRFEEEAVGRVTAGLMALAGQGSEEDGAP